MENVWPGSTRRVKQMNKVNIPHPHNVISKVLNRVENGLYFKKI